LKTVLDINNWNRASHFNFFKDFDNPFFNICSNIEITELYECCKEKDISFFLGCLYLSIKAANNIEEFRYRIEEDRVEVYDKIHPFSTVSNDDNTFTFCEFTYVDEFNEFQNKGKLAISDAINNRTLAAKEHRKDVIHYTTVPWISFTSLKHPRNFNTHDSIPKIAFGKYFAENDKLMIPISIEVHHSLLDGYHISKYLDLLRSYIVSSETLL